MQKVYHPHSEHGMDTLKYLLSLMLLNYSDQFWIFIIGWGTEP